MYKLRPFSEVIFPNTLVVVGEKWVGEKSHFELRKKDKSTTTTKKNSSSHQHMGSLLTGKKRGGLSFPNCYHADEPLKPTVGKITHKN